MNQHHKWLRKSEARRFWVLFAEMSTQNILISEISQEKSFPSHAPKVTLHSSSPVKATVMARGSASQLLAFAQGVMGAQGTIYSFIGGVV